MKFTAIVREQKSLIRLGKINSIKLCPYIGKYVVVTIKVIDPDTKLPPVKVKGVIKEIQKRSKPMGNLIKELQTLSALKTQSAKPVSPAPLFG